MSQSRCRPPVRWALRTVVVSFVVGAPSLGVSGCLDRPVSPAEPETTNVLVEPFRQERIERIDLLFMIDNSISMADKQAMLASAVPQLVKRLVQPRCVDALGNPTGALFPCAEGESAEFEPVVDIHVGVLSSSLGAHGGEICAGDTPPINDRAHLMPSVRPELGLPSDGNGFLWWNPGKNGFGEAEVQAFVERAKAHVQAAGEQGCGYEASLESWYRFLVEPSPPEKVFREGNQTLTSGVDQVLLEQRHEFLRPDSLLAIVMLSDENDCSIRDSDVGWYVTSNAELAPATSVCSSNPNDPCCRSCAADEAAGPPAGCQPLCADPACKPACDAGTAPKLPREEDKIGLRCYEQKRRFGIDFLYPTERYVNALSETRLCPKRADLDPAGCADAELVDNPLFQNPDGLRARTPDLVFLAGIVGVPWQDIATPETLSRPGELDYLTARQLTEAERWSWITRSAGNAPIDPLMQESSAPRSGAHPSGDPALSPASPDSSPDANAANGHEWRAQDVESGDLQYACTYALLEQETCAGNSTCDCYGAAQPGYTLNKPLCQAPDGSYSETQRKAKAYPGLRQLEVLRDFGENSIVGSICPKVLDAGSADYGYNPAVDAIVDRLAVHLSGRCLPRTLAIADGEVACRIIEASAGTSGCSCDASLGRTPIRSSLIEPAQRQLREMRACGPESSSRIPCESLCLCEIAPYTGEALSQCQSDPGFDATAGWCYVDPAQNYPAPNPGTEELVAHCAAHERRLLRVEPQSGATVLIACQGAPFE